MSITITTSTGKRFLSEQGFNVKDFIDVDSTKVFDTFHRMGRDIKNTIKKSFPINDSRIHAENATIKEITTGNVRFNYPKRRKYPRRRRGFLWKSIKVEVKNHKGSNDPLSGSISVYSKNKYAKELEGGSFNSNVIMPLQPANYYHKSVLGLKRIGRFLVTKIGKDLYTPEYLLIPFKYIKPYDYFLKGLDKYKRSELYKKRIQELVSNMGL